MTHAESIGYSHTEIAGGTPPLGLLKGGWSANIRGIILTKGDQVERLLHQNKNRKQTEEGASKKMLDSSQYHDPESNGVRGGWTDEGRTHFHHGVFFSLKLGVEEWIERWREEVSKRMGAPSKIIEDVLKLIHLELNGVLTALACNRGHMFLLGNFVHRDCSEMRDQMNIRMEESRKRHITPENDPTPSRTEVCNINGRWPWDSKGILRARPSEATLES
ncbi:hypothetical protein B0H11DRAFT_1911779 [Mycena galericulata]|nr:hypothetical protein B0H11DRAFT_1911779 [Mycena galericulata]